MAPLKRTKPKLKANSTRLNPKSHKILKLGRVTTESVHKGTKRHWHEWISILNRAGASNWSHQEIVKHLAKKFRLSQWWQQGVSFGYEFYLGKRVEGRNSKGLYSLTVSKTIPCDQQQMWEILISEEGQRIWLRPFDTLEISAKTQYENDLGVFGQIRTLKSMERIRLTWQETEWIKPSVVLISIIPRNTQKCELVVCHTDIPSSVIKDSLRTHWKAVLMDVQRSVTK